VLGKACDVMGDGLADIITGAGRGGTPDVRVFNGATGAQISGTRGDFHAYSTAFAGRVRLRPEESHPALRPGAGGAHRGELITVGSCPSGNESTIRPRRRSSVNA